MVNRWLNILISIWLINTIIGFQGATAPDLREDGYRYAYITTARFTLLDIITGRHFTDGPAKKQKINHRDRFVNFKGHDLGVQIFLQLTFFALLAILACLTVRNDFRPYARRNTSTRYYAFISRLTPF